MATLPEITTTREGSPYQVGHLQYLLEYCRGATHYSPLAHTILDLLARGEELGILYSPYPNYNFESIRSPLSSDLLQVVAPSSLSTPHHLPPPDIDLHTPPINVITADMMETPYAVQFAGSPPAPIIYTPSHRLYRPIDTPVINRAIPPIQRALSFPLSLEVDSPQMRWGAKRWTAGGWDGYEDHMANQAMDAACEQPILASQSWDSIFTLFQILNACYSTPDFTTPPLAQLGFEPLLIAIDDDFPLGHGVQLQSNLNVKHAEVKQPWRLATDTGTSIVAGVSCFDADQRIWFTPPALSLEQLHYRLLQHQTPAVISATSAYRNAWIDTFHALDAPTFEAIAPTFILTEYWVLASMNAQTARIHALLHTPLSSEV